MSTAGHLFIWFLDMCIFRKDEMDEIKKSLLRCGLCDDLALFWCRRLREIFFEKIEKIRP